MMPRSLGHRWLSARRWRVALAVVAITVPALASGAPSDQYEQFDQSSVEVKDHFTGLSWDRRRVEKLPQSMASFYCSTTVFSGTGRVPTVKELLTLVDEDAHQAFENASIVNKAVDQAAFPDAATPTDVAYWTSTPGTTSDGSAAYWTVEFTSGKTALAIPTTSLNVRCLH